MNGTQLRWEIVDFCDAAEPMESGLGAPTFCRPLGELPCAWMLKEPGGQPVPLGASARADKMSALPVQTAAPRQAPNCTMTSLH